MLAIMCLSTQTGDASTIHADPRRASAHLRASAGAPAPAGKPAAESRTSHPDGRTATDALVSSHHADPSSSDALGYKDPRSKADNHNSLKHHSSSSKASLDPRLTSAKNRSNSGRNRYKEWTNDHDQLFKPDVITKVPSKIKIDIDPSKINAHVNRDPRMKSRDPRTMGNDSKPENIDAATARSPASIIGSDSSNTQFSTKDDKLASAKDKIVTATIEKDLHKKRERSAERREEIRRELKRVDRRESRKEENSVPTQQRKEKKISLKPRESSGSRNRARSSRDNENKLNSSNTESKYRSKSPSLNVDSTNDMCITTQSPVVMSSSTSDSTSLTSTSTSAAFDIASPSRTTPQMTDSFRSVDRANSRKRNLRKRTTPSPEVLDQTQSFSTETSIEKKAGDASDSDESDHYDANKPSPALYTDKKGNLFTNPNIVILFAIILLNVHQ